MRNRRGPAGKQLRGARAVALLRFALVWFPSRWVREYVLNTCDTVCATNVMLYPIEWFYVARRSRDGPDVNGREVLYRISRADHARPAHAPPAPRTTELYDTI